MHLCTFAIKKILKLPKMETPLSSTIEDSSGLRLILTFAHIAQPLNMIHVIVKENNSPRKIDKHRTYINDSSQRNSKITLLQHLALKSNLYMIKTLCLIPTTHAPLRIESKILF